MGLINYSNPGWTNNSTPAINQTNLGYISAAVAAIGAMIDSGATSPLKVYNDSNVGTNWPTALVAALGTNWTTALAAALGTNWATVLNHELPAANVFQGQVVTKTSGATNYTVPAGVY